MTSFQTRLKARNRNRHVGTTSEWVDNLPEEDRNDFIAAVMGEYPSVVIYEAARDMGYDKQESTFRQWRRTYVKNHSGAKQS